MAWSLVQAVEGAHRERGADQWRPGLRGARTRRPRRAASHLNRAACAVHRKRLADIEEDSSGPGRSQLPASAAGAPHLLGHRARPRRDPPRSRPRSIGSQSTPRPSPSTSSAASGPAPSGAMSRAAGGDAVGGGKRSRDRGATVECRDYAQAPAGNLGHEKGSPRATRPPEVRLTARQVDRPPAPPRSCAWCGSGRGPRARRCSTRTSRCDILECRGRRAPARYRVARGDPQWSSRQSQTRTGTQM